MKILVKCDYCGKMFLKKEWQVKTCRFHFCCPPHFYLWRVNKRTNGRPATRKFERINNKQVYFRITSKRVGLAVGRQMTRYCKETGS